MPTSCCAGTASSIRRSSRTRLRRGRLRLDESQHEAIARAALLAGGLRRAVPVARIGRVAQHVALAVELEARGEDLLLHELLVDAMQLLGIAIAAAGRRAVV